MGRTLTDNTGFAVAREELGTDALPGEPIWRTLEPNDVTDWGSTITKTPRDPISKSRERRKGTTTDLDSGMSWDGDLTREHALIFTDGFMFASYVGLALSSGDRAGASGDTQTELDVTADGSFDHATLSAPILPATLVYTRGFALAANNGLFEVDTGGTTTRTPVVGGGPLIEATTGPQNATLETAGFRFLDLTWTTATKTLSSAGTNMTTIGLSVGQFIQVGGPNAKRFGGTDLWECRVISIAANDVVVDKIKDITGTASESNQDTPSEVDVMFGRFVRNVPVDDGDFLEVPYRFEASWDGLGDGGANRYEYSKKNYANTMAWTFNGQDKATIDFGFVGSDTDPPVAAQQTGASTPVRVVQSAAYNTSADFLRLRFTDIDESGLTTDFADVTVTLDNQVEPEKVLNFLGAKYLNLGTFLVNINGEALFTSEAVIERIRENTTVTAELGIANGDGAMYLDIPQMTLGNGGRNLERNASVKVALEGEAYGDSAAPVPHSIGISFFPIVSTS